MLMNKSKKTEPYNIITNYIIKRKMKLVMDTRYPSLINLVRECVRGSKLHKKTKSKLLLNT